MDDIVVPSVVKSYKYSLNLIMKRELSDEKKVELCENKIKSIARALIEKNIWDASKIKSLISVLAKGTYKIPYSGNEEFIRCVTEKFYQDAQIPSFSGESDFRYLPVEDFKRWFGVAISRVGFYNECKTLLAWLWLFRNMTGENAYAGVESVQKITGLSCPSVRMYLQSLANLGLISPKQADGHYYLNGFPFQKVAEYPVEVDIDNSIVAKFQVNFKIFDLGILPYVFSNNVNSHCPFVSLEKIIDSRRLPDIKSFRDYIEEYTKAKNNLIVHKDVLNIDYFLASILTESDYRELVKKHYGNKSGVSRGMKQFKNNVMDYHKSFIANPPVSRDLNEHYRQIHKVLPILHFIARREFSIDPFRGAELEALYTSRIKVLFEGIMSHFNDDPQGFIHENGLSSECVNYGELIDIKIISVKIIKKKNEKAKTDDEEKRIEFIFKSDSVIVKPEKMYNEDIIEWNRYSWLYDDLKKVLDHAKRNYYASITNDFSVLKNLTHRIYSRGISTQNINKKNRKVFYAGKDFQFFMVDISQMELELLKLYINYEIGPGEFDGVSFEMMAREISVERSVVKISFYKWFYGSGKSKIMEDPEMTDKKYKRFIEFLGGFPELKLFRKKLEKEAKKNHCSRSTPLGYKMPIEDRFYRASSCLIQATGAEIFIRWILELHKKNLSEYHKKNLSEYIVNLIHDELIFKIPVEKNLYDFAKTVKACLDIASSEISKRLGHKLFFEAKQFVGKYWDKESGAEIILKG